MNRLQLTAHAKINLTLAIRYKRPDGFHEIESVFQELEFGDDLYLQPGEEVIFETDSPILQKETGNLCLKAVDLMREQYRIPGLSMHLLKKIPIGAGLGGGSSDAAAVLTGINTLYDLKLNQAELCILAGRIGSDVPFFIRGGTAYVCGRGEQLTVLKLDTAYTVVLVHPGVRIDTAWAYANLKMGLTKEFKEPKFIGFEFQNLTVENFRTRFQNDFEISVFSAFPQLAECKELLYRGGADFAGMSGSGSTVFGIFRRKAEADAIYDDLKSRYSCTLTRPVEPRP
jgi:4-diphosphocytidyl-2-C-methyl-D-erythritol kinase